ncbi:hypothetical protein DFH08DRAFT_1011576 [Mycena albidolilacea]|uniref:Uncharacterized protein n=1 Tax=Mycena albidolilacea TaxID=1033008 RepID=A0AAD7ENL5_9AGAR|nr:hypothetical protein DFH08DRAFT_1011576 [Mycena albidolilacea]
MGVSPEQYAALKNASERFLPEEDFSYPHTTELMKTVFGSNCASPEALAWAKYWTDLGDADEKIQAGQKATLPKLPPMCTQAGSSNGAMEDRDIKMPDSQPTLSNASLGSDRVDERARRKANGNIHGKEKKDIGRGFDDLMASVFIERKSVNGAGIMKPIYYCIGCDTSCRNNTRKRNTPHMLACKALQRDFPRTYKEFKDAIQPSAEQVASGEAAAPTLRTKRRRIEDTADGRVPIPGITAPLPSDSEESSRKGTQQTLDASWGSSNITAVRQSIIDYLLLRLIVCCALAFSLCDNGFFIDFCNAMCPGYSVPDRSNFISYDLVMEAENAMKHLQELLESFIHLIMSFDGWSSWRNDEIYTVHVSTPTHMSYLVAGIILTGLSTTGETIFENLKNTSWLAQRPIQKSTGLKDSNANILARLGIKLFSVVPSEMCDERTASKLTAMSTAKRNNLGPENLIRCAQLNQYWRYGFGSSEVKQHCQKVRLELPMANHKPSDPVVSGIPTLQDLLNADSEQVAIDEDALFNHPDPYGMEDLEAMEEGEDDIDTAAAPLVIRRANFPTLGIEAYIDLKAPKLTQRFAATQGMPEEPTARPAKLPAKPSTGSWTTKDAEWDAGN